MRGTQRRLSAGVVVVRPDAARGYLFLLLRAYRNWDFPKGMVEAGEDPRGAAVRETAEETGIADLQFRWGDDWIETGPYSRRKTARYYLAETRTRKVTLGVNPELGRPEHHEYRWVDLARALGIAPPRVRPVIEWAARRLGLAFGGDD